jgi:hypothetical protein
VKACLWQRVSLVSRRKEQSLLLLSGGDLGFEDTLYLGLSALDFLACFAGSLALDDGFILKWVDDYYSYKKLRETRNRHDKQEKRDFFASLVHAPGETVL